MTDTRSFLDDHVMVIPVTMPPRPQPKPAKRLIQTEPASELSRDGRTAKLIWEVSAGATPDGGTTRELAVLSVFHNPSRKAFGVSLSRMTEAKEPDSSFTSRSHFPFDAVRLPGIPVARFSAKAMRDALTAALICLVNRADEPGVAKVFGEPIQ